MAAKHETIVIGSGHNGLTCACYLAKAGLKVLVLEQYHSIGGMTNMEEITLPGFKSDTHAMCIQFANFSPALDELHLPQYGFEMICPDPCLTHAFPAVQCMCVRYFITDIFNCRCCEVKRSPFLGPDYGWFCLVYQIRSGAGCCVRNLRA